MDFTSKLIADLRTLAVRVNGDGTVTIADHSLHTLSPSKAMTHLEKRMHANASFLCGLWKQASERIKPGMVTASRDGYRSLFVSAAVGLSENAPLILKPAFTKLAVLQNRIAESDMSRLIDYRLSVDWMRNLVAQDARRIYLINMLYSPLAKKAQQAGFGRNYDDPTIKAIPWDQYYEDFLDTHRGDAPNPRRDLSEREKEERLRSQQGAAMDPDNDHGTILTAYDDIANGLFDGTHLEGNHEDTMQDMFENNEKWMDHSTDEERLGVDEDKGPLSTRPGRLI